MTVRAIKPIAMVVASSLFEAAPTAYAAGATYNLNNYASVTGVLGEILIYKSLQNGNIGNTPATSPTFWVYSSSTYVPWVFTSRFTGAYQLGQKVLYASEIYESVAADNAGVLDPVSNPPWSSAGAIQNPVDPSLFVLATTYALNAIVKGKSIPSPGTPESFKVLMRELQSLGLDIAVHKVEVDPDGESRDVEVDLMADVVTRRTPSRPTYESFAKEEVETDGN